MLGRNITFEWGDEEIPGVREKSIANAGEPVDVTSDEDNGWRKLLTESGQNQIDITVNGVTKSNALRADWYAGTRTKTLTITYPDGGAISGTFFMANFNETGPYNDATTFEATFQSSGEITYTNYS